MNRIILSLSAALISLTGLAAHAGDLNAMMKEAGEWEMTMTGAGGLLPTTTQRGCYAGNKSIADLTTKSMKNCSQQSVSINGQTYHRVRLGPFPSATDLESTKQRLAGAGINAIALKEGK